MLQANELPRHPGKRHSKRARSWLAAQAFPDDQRRAILQHLDQHDRIAAELVVVERGMAQDAPKDNRARAIADIGGLNVIVAFTVLSEMRRAAPSLWRVNDRHKAPMAPEPPLGHSCFERWATVVRRDVRAAAARAPTFSIQSARSSDMALAFHRESRVSASQLDQTCKSLRWPAYGVRCAVEKKSA